MGENGAPLVSVIMPTYNCGKYIAQSIDSVIAQTVKNWEIEIMDDCSTDNTEEVLRPYLAKYDNIHYYKLTRNAGPAGARTEALRRARGQYIAFLDSDDIWTPDKLEKQIAFMRKNEAMFSCTGYAQIDEENNPLGVAYIPPKKTDYARALRLGNPLGNLTVMYDQIALGKYEVPSIKKRNDFALWLRILRDTDYCYGMPEILASYRIREKSVSSNKVTLIKYHWQLYREIEKLSVIRSIWGIVCWLWVKATGRGLQRQEYEVSV